MKQFIALIGMTLFANFASATDARIFTSRGFSADGRYYAFTEHVRMDGSGYPAAWGYVVDVARNQWVTSEQVILEDEAATEKQALDQLLTKLNLRTYGIDGSKLGHNLWIRLPTDLSAPDLNPSFSLYYAVNGGVSSVTPMYQLQVTELTPTDVVQCWGADRKMLALSLNQFDGVRIVNRLELQRDSRLPSRRACGSAYQPRQVIEFNGSIVVVMRYETQGFEGPDYNHMVVTARNVLN